MSNSIKLDKTDCGDPTPVDLRAKIDLVERNQEKVETALEGSGSYLGTRNHVSVAPSA